MFAVADMMLPHIARGNIMARWTKTVAERFADKVKVMPNGCHEWTGATSGSFHYGVFMVRTGLQMRAHRYAWEQANGPLAEGECVLHRCDNPRCVRVDHLFLGDRAVNSRDASVKGRLGQAQIKRTREQVYEALAMREDGATYQAIAARLGLSGNAEAWALLNERKYVRKLAPDYQLNRARSTITAEEIEAARAMRASGATWQATADALGVNMSSLFNHLPERDGHKRKLTDDHLAAVRAAMAAGETIKAVAARLGLKYSSVTTALKHRRPTP